MDLQKPAQSLLAVLCLCVVLLLPISSFAQSPDDAVTAQNGIASLPTVDFHRVSFLSTNFPAVSPDPLTEAESSSTAPTIAPPPPPRGGNRKLPRFGVAFMASTLGFGGQAATAVLHRANVRVGFNYFSYNLPTFTKDGASYTGSLNLRSFEANFDYYLFWGFHVSPGVLLYNRNKVSATASIPGGNTFTLGGISYTSDPADPVHDTGVLPLDKAAPTLEIGIGNLLPRSRRHLTFNFDFGVVFQQSPKVAISLAGTACPTAGGPCANAATDPNVQANIQTEEAKINKNLKVFQFYPIVSMEIGWKF